MSAKVVGKVWEIELTPPQQLVMLALADHANHEGGNVFPEVALIAWKTGYSRRQVQRIMRELVDEGLLVKVTQREGKPTVYQIDLSKGTQKEPYQKRKRDTGYDIAVSHPTHDTAMSYDNMSPVTSHGNEKPEGYDMPSAKVVRNRHKDNRHKTQERARDTSNEYADVPHDDRLQIIRAWTDALGAAPIGAFKNDNNHRVAAEIFRAGYRASQVALFVNAKKQDSFWRGKTLTLAKVAELMPEWLMNLKAKQTVPAGVVQHTDRVFEEWGTQTWVRQELKRHD